MIPTHTEAPAPTVDAPDSGVAAAECLLAKAPTGIHGFDEISGGGLPRGRATLVCGGPGTGKTLFAMEFLARGAEEFGEPGVFVSFEESSAELAANVRSLGFDVPRLVRERKLAHETVLVDRSELVQTGGYDLEGLFIRLDGLVRSIGARRVVLDTFDALFAGFLDPTVLRSELSRLLRWLKERGLTVVITGEHGDGEQTRYTLEEYVSDCVIVLDQRVYERNVTRYLRILKYRGSSHGSDEYPFLIYDRGLSILPLSELRLDHPASDERVSLGLPRLDAMLGGRGVHRGSSVLVSGSAGSGKTSIAASAARAACERGERCLYFAFEESPAQIVRNMRSIGLDLDSWIQRGTLRFSASRPTVHGLETHLVVMLRQIEEFDPHLVIVDPITNLSAVGSPADVRAMLARLIDALKGCQTTALFLSLVTRESQTEHSAMHVSSLMDTWLWIDLLTASGEMNRTLRVIKSRGTSHSNQIREVILSDRGLELTDVYVGPAGVLTGSARRIQERREQREAEERALRIARLERELASRRLQVQSQIQELGAGLAAEEQRLRELIDQEAQQDQRARRDREEMAHMRRADTDEPASPTGGAP